MLDCLDLVLFSLSWFANRKASVNTAPSAFGGSSPPAPKVSNYQKSYSSIDSFSRTKVSGPSLTKKTSILAPKIPC